MNTPTERTQIKIPADITAAILQVAASRRQTKHSCILCLLESHPDVVAALKVLASRVKESPPQVQEVVHQVKVEAPVVPGKAVWISPQATTIAPQGVSGPPLRGLKEYLASGGLNDDCTTVGGPLRVRATGEPLDINR